MFVVEHRRELLGSGFWLGVGVGIGVGVAASEGKHTLDNAIAVLTTEVLIGVALLATVLAALAILSTFFDRTYRDALRELSGSFLRAVLPYRVVAFSSATAAVAGVAAITLWGIFSHDLKSSAYGLVAGATASAIVGTWHLVRDTTFHGVKRDELLD